MRRAIFLIALFTLGHGLTRYPVEAGQKKDTEPNVQEIIQKFAAAESQNRIARAKYAFVQDQWPA